MKHNHPVLILQAWPVKTMQDPEESDIFQEQPLDQSALKKLTEEPLRTKIVRRRKKVLAGKRGCIKYSSIVFEIARDLF